MSKLFIKPFEELEAESLAIIDEAIAEYNPSKVFVGFSGGDDSLTTAILASKHPKFTGCIHINTGISIKAANQFVRDTCAKQKWPLIELHPPDKSYRDFVLEYGFPGPSAHRYAYVWLKERALNFFVTHIAKNSTNDRVMIVTGVRQQESRIRMGRVAKVQRDDCKVWVAPLLYWSKLECLRYIEVNNVERSPVAELLHLSGECLCGAFGSQEELAEIEMWFPDAAAQIRALEEEAKAKGNKHCQWGVRSPEERPDPDELDANRPLISMCWSCDARVA